MGMRRNARGAATAVAAMLVTVTACRNPVPPTSTTTTVTGPQQTTSTVQQTNREGYWELSGDVNAHDPSIIKSGNTWYSFTTGAGISVASSNGGLNWGGRRRVFGSQLSWWGKDDVWAPDVTAYRGQVHLYYAISQTFGQNDSAIGYATAPSPAGPFTDHGPVLRSTRADNYNAIDPELIIDAAGAPWLAFGSFWDGIKLTRLDGNMRPTGGLTALARRSSGIEAPAVLHRDGWYYLFASIDKCCQGVNSTYKIIYGRSRAVTGPYLDRNGRSLADQGGTVLDAGNDRWRGPGGQDVNEGNVLARHAYDATDGGRAKLLINGLRFPDGWPAY
jgi:arabinan endo-1,5-alpha-L-arabinosidase